MKIKKCSRRQFVKGTALADRINYQVGAHMWLISIIAAIYTRWGGLKASRHTNAKGDHAYG